MFEAEETKNDHCQKHGDFINEYMDYGPIGKRWNGCPECADEARAQKEEQSRREEEENRRQEWVRARLKNSHIPKKFQDKSFDNFQPINAKAEARKAAVMEYADTVCSKEHGGKSLIMVGKLGNGKTHLACALLADVIKRTASTGKYVTFSEVVRRVKASWKSGSEETEEQVYRGLSNPLLLIIDEVGMQNFTEFEQTVAYEVINARYLEELPTVLVTNLQAKDLSPTIGERAVDRLREGGGKALDFDWESYRAGVRS
jgi:DNA replication protein DnaC